jgi:hypothetical protein
MLIFGSLLLLGMIVLDVFITFWGRGLSLAGGIITVIVVLGSIGLITSGLKRIRKYINKE